MGALQALPAMRAHPAMSYIAFDMKVPGAWPNGTRVKKTVFEPRDAHPVGSLATVIGSAESEGILAYFVLWDDMPGVPVFVVAAKIDRV